MQLTKFVDPLPIPPVLKPDSRKYCTSYYTVRMQEAKHKFHRDLDETTIWGYEGMYPGPTIETHTNDTVKVKWENHLPHHHILPLDTTVHGAGHDAPHVRTVVHLHGANVSPDSDGYPEAWFTKDYEEVGQDFVRETYEYPNQQKATTLWYHDHAIGITRLNVYAGLAGFYIIRDSYESVLKLPSGKFEIPLLIQDKSFNDDGSLFYPSRPANIPPDVPNFPFPSIVPGFFGDTIVVNGKVWPYLEVEPRKYRFRILNGSNSRFYNLILTKNQNGEPPPWYQIGTDGGLLEHPVPLDNLLIAPSERADIIIDFTKFANQNIRFTNEQPPITDDTSQVMEFRVKSCVSTYDYCKIPSFLTCVPRLKEDCADNTRDVSIGVTLDQYRRPTFLLSGKHWDDPVTEKPYYNSTEIWRIINPGFGIHPIHIHLVQFQILDHQPFDAALYNRTGEIRFTGPAVLPPPNERGWKDTVKVPGSNITRVIMKFSGFHGKYVWHCHILEHEDYDMMRPMNVIQE